MNKTLKVITALFSFSFPEITSFVVFPAWRCTDGPEKGRKGLVWVCSAKLMLFLEVWGFIDAGQQAVTGQTPHSASEGAQTLIYGSWFLKGSCANANAATGNRAGGTSGAAGQRHMTLWTPSGCRRRSDPGQAPNPPPAEEGAP